LSITEILRTFAVVITSEEKYYAMALTRLAGLSQAMALELYRRVGSA
jgi:hypothetical protein